MSINYDQLADAIVRELVRQPGAWLTFRQLALRIYGDVNSAEIVASVATNSPDLFAVHRDARVKLREEAIEKVVSKRREEGPGLSPAHVIAERAVREYARQLYPYHVPVVGVDFGNQILERYVHALTIDISDDDIKLTDDTPVEHLSRTGGRNTAHIF